MSKKTKEDRGWRRFKRLSIDKKTVKKRVKKIENVSIRHAAKFVTKRWISIQEVSRNISIWLTAVFVLIALVFFQVGWFSGGYMTNVPQAGGLYAEGLVGRIETMNPLYTKNRVEKTAEKLLFSGLLDYDGDGKLRNMVASSWRIDNDKKTYKVFLRDDVFWHDGKKLTVDDVIFTVKLMQNPETKTTFYKSWSGIKVKKISKNEINFILPTTYAPFAHALTFSILPKHLLEGMAVNSIRESDFGKNPVGSGPFIFKRVQVVNLEKGRIIISMEPNEKYFRSKPLIGRFQIHTYDSDKELRNGLISSEINASLGLGSSDVSDIKKLGGQIDSHKLAISNGVFAIFNNKSVSNENLRQALTEATDVGSMINNVLNNDARRINGPLVGDEFGIKPNIFDKKKAKERLESLGWKMNGEYRQKDGKTLEISILATDSGEYPAVANWLEKQWKEIGIKAKVKLAKSDELLANYVQPRAFDVLIQELAIGADPDVYAYWHSSQAKSGGLNFADYRSGSSDDILSSARSRLETNLRNAKYGAFVEQWKKDSPAVPLYQPVVNYTTTKKTKSVVDGNMVDVANRFYNVEDWTASEGRKFKTP